MKSDKYLDKRQLIKLFPVGFKQNSITAIKIIVDVIKKENGLQTVIDRDVQENKMVGAS